MPSSFYLYFLALVLFAVVGAIIIIRRLRARRPPRDIAHIFLDLETLGTRYDAPVLVIAAYAVDNTGREVASTVLRVLPWDATAHGTPNKETEAWWGNQSSQARFAAFEEGPRMTLRQALHNLSTLVKELDAEHGEVLVWGNAPSFDCSILRYAYDKVGLDTPWKFYQERDCRTVAWLGEAAGFDAKNETRFQGTPHVAIDDARHQARYTMSILKHLGSA